MTDLSRWQQAGTLGIDAPGWAWLMLLLGILLGVLGRECCVGWWRAHRGGPRA